MGELFVAQQSIVLRGVETWQNWGFLSSSFFIGGFGACRRRPCEEHTSGAIWRVGEIFFGVGFFLPSRSNRRLRRAYALMQCDPFV